MIIRSKANSFQKIIHVDMDCFYAAIEVRDNSALAGKPVAVGGAVDKRGVICTCNYVARQYGVRSAMATATAYRHCKDLILLPVNMPKYRQVTKRIHAIFREFTDLIEPLALDEAYLDVTNSTDFKGSATLIAKAIRQQIWKTEQLTASAGVAPNKFLAKIASGWKKPNGLFIIRPHEVTEFIKNLSVTELHGVGKVNAKKLYDLNIKNCYDLQKLSLKMLVDQFGKLGQHLYEQCRGIDQRRVEPNRIRKSLSIERTFSQDIDNLETCMSILRELHDRLIKQIQESAPNRVIKNQYIKIKFSDFKQTSAEIISSEANLEKYIILFRDCYARSNNSLRLLGMGVHFHDEIPSYLQQPLF